MFPYGQLTSSWSHVKWQTNPSSDPSRATCQPLQQAGDRPGLGVLTPEMGSVTCCPTELPSGSVGDACPALGTTSGSVTGKDKGGRALLATGRGHEARPGQRGRPRRHSWRRARTVARVGSAPGLDTPASQGAGLAARGGSPRSPEQHLLPGLEVLCSPPLSEVPLSLADQASVLGVGGLLLDSSEGS